ncbi:hypothetical protein Desaci_4311 [Desulfosporosinus acidiphilus SJ4]|uniref:Cytoplasmic protein n=1 Tax=Desulfosporosinus acidiphilus (strain DSM 22704 / JCM 16185 / SJ4) TaxID=646529 RepID=I4DBI8_DESAJ|nr:DUF1697 domain-containing protein [Desulfosporosinus acidiphilus]AFM43162.1 hypothetical protein Desaci_4311 [Desulfosporosinus acidiphilus SJ4]
MTTYIALLRGINVGGKNVIKMVDLKKVFEAMGLSDVQTYIQSGNVLFKSNEQEESLRNRLEHQIEATFGFSVTVVLRTSAELQQLISDYPFSEEETAAAAEGSDFESQYVALLTHEPLKEKIVSLDTYANTNNQFQIIGRDVFLLLHQSIRNSQLANNLYKLGVPATMRNWKTISKIAALAKTKET